MGKGISEVLTFAVGVAISPVPIIAVILILFSSRAKVNGPSFLLGWVLALGIVSTVVYLIANQSSPTTSSTASDSISWGKIVLGGCSCCSRCAAGETGQAWHRAGDAEMDGGGRRAHPRVGVRARAAVIRPEPQEPDTDDRGSHRPGTAKALDDGRGRLLVRVRDRRQPDDRRPGRLLPPGRREGETRP